MNRPLNELKYEAFRASVAGSGRVAYNDLEKAFYAQSTGIPKATERDYWRQFNPTFNLSLNDLKELYLEGLYGPGEINDLEQRYWTAAGAPTVTSAPILLTAVQSVPATFTAGVYTGTGNTVTRAWLIDAVVVQTGGVYTPLVGDVGKTLTLRETVVNAFGSVVSTSNGIVVT